MSLRGWAPLDSHERAQKLHPLKQHNEKDQGEKKKWSLSTSVKRCKTLGSISLDPQHGTPKLFAVG